MTQQFHSWVHIQKTKNKTTTKNRNTNSKRYMHPNVCGSITIAKTRKQPECLLTDKWMWYIYNVILFSHKKERNLAICSNTDGLGGYCVK